MQKRKGLTLVEIVISMALIGMVAIVFLTIFTTGNKNIINSAKRTEDVLNVQQEIDNGIKNHNKGVDTINVILPGVEETISITGSLIDINKDGIKITTFIPDDQ